LKVSVITCCWNSEPFIAECISSVVNQTYSNIEHVFVDGGSTDGTLERIKELSGQVKWVTDIRGGISNAMNVGVQHATGDLIIHLHGDDFFMDPTVVARMVAIFENSPDTPWIFGRIANVVDGQIEQQRWLMPMYSYRRLLKGNFIAHPAVFIRRELFVKSKGFDCSLKYAMDYDLWLRLAKDAPPKFVDIVVSAFRCHPGSASTANALKAFQEDHQVRKKYIAKNWFSKVYHALIFYWRRRKMGLNNG
jgi:glycosyltransferase involved in cell wall biosynthesis